MSALADGIIKNPKIGFKFDNSNLQLKNSKVETKLYFLPFTWYESFCNHRHLS